MLERLKPTEKQRDRLRNSHVPPSFSEGQLVADLGSATFSCCPLLSPRLLVIRAFKNRNESQVGWGSPVTPALWVAEAARDRKFEPSLGDLAIWQDLVSKNIKGWQYSSVQRPGFNSQGHRKKGRKGRREGRRET